MKSRVFKATNIVLGLLCMMYFLTYVDRVNVSTAAGVFRKELNLSNTQVGLVFSAFAYPYLLFQVIGGWVADHFGPRKALTICGVVWAGATIMFGMVHGLAAMIAVRVLLGFGAVGLGAWWQLLPREKWSDALVFIVAVGLVLVGAAVLSRPLASAPLVKHPFVLKSAATLPVQPSGTKVVAGHLVIPSLHVDAAVVTTSIVDHELVVPVDVHDVGEWGRQANAGTTIVAGHINWVGQGPGALGGLANIAPGATVYLANRAGVVSVWSVVSLRAVLKKGLLDVMQAAIHWRTVSAPDASNLPAPERTVSPAAASHALKRALRSAASATTSDSRLLKPSSKRRSITGRMFPRTVNTPSTCLGVPGTSLGRSTRRISRTRSM